MTLYHVSALWIAGLYEEMMTIDFLSCGVTEALEVVVVIKISYINSASRHWGIHPF